LPRSSDVAPMNDAYKTYNDAVIGVDQVFDALQTEAGRQAVGAQMLFLSVTSWTTLELHVSSWK